MRLVFRRNWQIVVAAAVFFGLGHLTGEGVTVLSLLSNSLGGAIYTVAFMAAGNLFFPWALHFSWNAFQFFYGFRISGLEGESVISQVSLRQNFASGGEYGPESGLLGIAIRLVVLVLISAYVSRSRGKSLWELVRSWPSHIEGFEVKRKTNA